MNNVNYGDGAGQYITVGKNNLCVGIRATSAFDGCTIIGDNCLVIGNHTDTNGFSNCILIGDNLVASSNWHVAVRTPVLGQALSPEDINTLSLMCKKYPAGARLLARIITTATINAREVRQEQGDFK